MKYGVREHYALFNSGEIHMVKAKTRFEARLKFDRILMSKKRQKLLPDYVKIKKFLPLGKYKGSLKEWH